MIVNQIDSGLLEQRLDSRLRGNDSESFESATLTLFTHVSAYSIHV
jgi:hypothetical protein